MSNLCYKITVSIVSTCSFVQVFVKEFSSIKRQVKSIMGEEFFQQFMVSKGLTKCHNHCHSFLSPYNVVQYYRDAVEICYTVLETDTQQ